MKTLLVADEDDRIKNLVRLVSEQTGYKVVATRSGVQAVLKAKDIRPEIVLADISLSDKNGYEVSREIRNDPSLKNTFVLLLSASPITFDKRKAAEVYADDFILKPLRSEELMTKLGPLAVQNKNEPKLPMNSNAQSIKSITERKVIFVNVIAVVFVIFMFIALVAYRLSGVNLLHFGQSEIQLKSMNAIEEEKGVKNDKEEVFTQGNKPFPELKAYSGGLVNNIDEKARGKEVFQGDTSGSLYGTSIRLASDIEKGGVENSGLGTKPVLSSNQGELYMGEISSEEIKNRQFEKRKTLAVELERNKENEGQTIEELKPTRHKYRVLKVRKGPILKRKALALEIEKEKKKETTLKDVYELAEELRKKIGE